MELSPLLSVFKKLDVVTAAPNVASRRTNSVDIKSAKALISVDV